MSKSKDIMTNPKTLSQNLFAGLGKPIAKFYAIKNGETNQYLEIAYNLHSKKEVAKVMREFLQPSTEVIDYSQMTDRDFFRYIKTQMLDRWTLETSKVMFDWSIFEN